MLTDENVSEREVSSGAQNVDECHRSLLCTDLSALHSCRHNSADRPVPRLNHPSFFVTFAKEAHALYSLQRHLRGERGKALDNEMLKLCFPDKPKGLGQLRHSPYGIELCGREPPTKRGEFLGMMRRCGS